MAMRLLHRTLSTFAQQGNQDRCASSDATTCPQLDLLRGAVGLVALCLALRVARHPSESEQVQYAFHLRADTLFAGVALGYLFHFRPKMFNAVSRWPLLVVAIVALIPLFGFRSGSDAPWVLTCNLIGFVAVVWWIVPRSNIRMPLVEQVGVYSYSIYLWHFPVALPLVLYFSRTYRLHWLLLYVVVSIAAGIYIFGID